MLYGVCQYCFMRFSVTSTHNFITNSWLMLPVPLQRLGRIQHHRWVHRTSNNEMTRTTIGLANSNTAIIKIHRKMSSLIRAGSFQTIPSSSTISLSELNSFQSECSQSFQDSSCLSEGEIDIFGKCKQESWEPQSFLNNRVMSDQFGFQSLSLSLQRWKMTHSIPSSLTTLPAQPLNLIPNNL